jgi:hypothetical protein
MKRDFRSALVAASLFAAVSFTPAQAATFTDTVGDLAPGIGVWPHLDIAAVHIENTETRLNFKIDLAGNPGAPDWGKYTIGIITAPGGDPTGDGWARPIGMSFAGLGMNYWVGSWTDSGNGAELRKWDGAAWPAAAQSATYGANPDSLIISKDSSSVTIEFNISGLGLSLGNTFFFDVYTTGGGGSDSAVDALANPLTSITSWSEYYNSGFRVQSYTLVPEPSSFALLGVGVLMLIGRARRR